MQTLPRNEIIRKETSAHANASSKKDIGSKDQKKNGFHFARNKS